MPKILGSWKKVTPAWKNMAIFCIYAQVWGVNVLYCLISPTWTSPEVGINEDLQVISYVYIGVLSHNPLIRSPLIPSTSGPRDIQAVEICQKFWGKRHVFMQNNVCSRGGLLLHQLSCPHYRCPDCQFIVDNRWQVQKQKRVTYGNISQMRRRYGIYLPTWKPGISSIRVPFMYTKIPVPWSIWWI